MGVMESQPWSGFPEMTFRFRVCREMGAAAVSEASGEEDSGVARYSQRLAHSARSNSLLYGRAFFVTLKWRIEARLLGVKSDRKGTAASMLVWKENVYVE